MTRYVLDARTAISHFPGLGRYVVNLARAIIPLLDHDELLILLRDPTQTSAFNLDTLTGPQVQVVDTPVSPFALRQQWVIPRLLRQLKANLYHSPYYLMPYFIGVPTLLTIYDLIPLRYPCYFSKPTRLLFKWATSLAIRTAHHVTTISEVTRKDLLTFYHLPPSKVTTIHLAADPHFQPTPGEQVAALRRRLDLPAEYALYVGSNKPHKNLVRLVEAWAKLQPQPLPLVIAGVWDVRYPQAWQRVEALALGAMVRFLGPIAEDDLPALYSGATLFVFPSEYEGFGLPVLEAMACGTPVICSNNSSLLEVAGEAALTVTPTNVAEIATALQSLWAEKDRQAEMRTRGFRRAGQFTWHRTARETLAIYRQTVQLQLQQRIQ